MSESPKHRSRPARQVCPLCGLDDDEFLSWKAEAPGLWRFTCTNHSVPYSWVTTGEGAFDESGAGGIAEKLGVYDDLLALFPEPGPFLEYGIVEHRYAEAHPHPYRELVGRYSHTAYGPTKYSVSAFLGLAAGRLSRQGHLAFREVPATGYWHYNAKVGAFCLAPAPEDNSVVSWAEYATSLGFHPDDWPSLGYQHGQPPLPKPH